MAPIVKSLPSYIKDSQHAIFRDFNFLGEDKLIFTMDISSLYTVIPNSEGLQALRYFFDQRTVTEPVARHFNLPKHSKEHMSICGLSLHQGTTDSRKNLEQRFIFQIGTLNPHGINEWFSFN